MTGHKIIAIATGLTLFSITLVWAQRDKVYTNLEVALANKEQVYHLNLASQNLTVIPAAIGELTKLDSLDLSLNMLTDLPMTLKNLKNLTYLNIQYNRFPVKMNKRLLISTLRVRVLKKLPPGCTVLSGNPAY